MAGFDKELNDALSGDGPVSDKDEWDEDEYDGIPECIGCGRRGLEGIVCTNCGVVWCWKCYRYPGFVEFASEEEMEQAMETFTSNCGERAVVRCPSCNGYCRHCGDKDLERYLLFLCPGCLENLDHCPDGF